MVTSFPCQYSFFVKILLFPAAYFIFFVIVTSVYDSFFGILFLFSTFAFVIFLFNTNKEIIVIIF